MPTWHDDNFGHWQDLDDPDMAAFCRETARTSVPKTCEGCGRTVRLRPDYAWCNACAEARERSGEY